MTATSSRIATKCCVDKNLFHNLWSLACPHLVFMLFELQTLKSAMGLSYPIVPASDPLFNSRPKAKKRVDDVHIKNNTDCWEPLHMLACFLYNFWLLLFLMMIMYVAVCRIRKYVINVFHSFDLSCHSPFDVPEKLYRHSHRLVDAEFQIDKPCPTRWIG